MKLIIGLGNPGKEYEHTRHNFGWDVVSALASYLHATPFQTKASFHASLSEVTLDGKKILFVLPLTFMNLSGEAVLSVKQFYKVADQDMLIVHDEMDFVLGQFAFTPSGRAAGHNGVQNIFERLGTQDLARLRLGIGRSPDQKPSEAFVLERFTKDEQQLHEQVLHDAMEAVETWLEGGMEKAMNVWNGKKGLKN